MAFERGAFLLDYFYNNSFARFDSSNLWPNHARLHFLPALVQELFLAQ